MATLTRTLPRYVTPVQIFMASAFVVNGGNYAYNLLLGRFLGPAAFADAAVLITLLLVLSFVAMTFQLTVTRFIAGCEVEKQDALVKTVLRYATATGIVLGLLCVAGAPFLQMLFQTASSTMFVIFGLAIPLYLVMSVNRGNLQGNQLFIKLSVTYQLEMLTRLALTFCLLLWFNIEAPYAVSLAIALSFIAGLFPIQRRIDKTAHSIAIPANLKQQMLQFFLLTASYELTQILINNSDILLVKHYFEAFDAGLYASLALIGRVVYFVTWMFVMALLPKVVALHKAGKNAVPLLMTYLRYIGLLAFAITAFTFLVPEFAVRVLFGKAYLDIAPLLGWYALATSLFAISNVLAYYFLSLDRYKPVIIAGIFGVFQIILVVFFHTTLMQVVLSQVIAMGCLLGAQLVYFKLFNPYSKKISS